MHNSNAYPMEKSISKTVSMPNTWWETIDTLETDRSKYIQGLVKEDFRIRGIGEQTSDHKELIPLILEAREAGVDVRAALEGAMSEALAS